MTRESIKKIVAAVTKECDENFDKHKYEGYTLANKTTIPFTSKTLYSRVVSDWGTDEDRDEIICYSKDGWEVFDITVQVGAGVQKVITQCTKKINQNDVVELFEEMDDWQQLEFMHEAYEVLFMSEYKVSLL